MCGGSKWAGQLGWRAGKQEVESSRYLCACMHFPRKQQLCERLRGWAVMEARKSTVSSSIQLDLLRGETGLPLAIYASLLSVQTDGES